jgi:solute carrier family 25 phosphate transporter 23/24/25/41
MVLRGSKLKPHKSLTKAKMDLELAKAEAQKQEEHFHVLSEQIWERLDGLKDSEKDLTKQELYTIIHTLHTRINTLEDERRHARESVQESYSEVIKIGKQLVAGGLAGCVARTCVAPIDRTKILMQTQALTQRTGSDAGAPKEKYRGIAQTWRVIVAEEGISRLWRGNAVNCIRVAPYSATQFASYEKYKRLLGGGYNGSSDASGDFGVAKRLLCGALAGATATTVTHPLDVVRLRLAVTPELRGFADAVRHVTAENGLRSLFKGYVPTLLSLSPFIAINFSAFDTLKKYSGWDRWEGWRRVLGTLGLGAVAGLFAQTMCYPLDTVRRRMQLPGTHYKGVLDAFVQIPKKEGFRGFYKGMAPNALKIVPNNGIRFLAYEFIKRQIGAEDRRR